MSETFSRSNKLLREVVQIATTEIAHLNALEVLPNALVGIKIRCIARQLFQMHPFSCARFEKGFDLFAAMDRRSVPDEPAALLPLIRVPFSSIG